MYIQYTRLDCTRLGYIGYISTCTYQWLSVLKILPVYRYKKQQADIAAAKKEKEQYIASKAMEKAASKRYRVVSTRILKDMPARTGYLESLITPDTVFHNQRRTYWFYWYFFRKLCLVLFIFLIDHRSVVIRVLDQ